MAPLRSLALIVALLALSSRPAGAVITRVYPLKSVLSEADTIAVARVETWSGWRRFALGRTAVLKGKPAWRRVQVRLSGSDNREHRPSVRERLAKGRSLVLFTKTGRFTLGYVDGMWFRVTLPATRRARTWQFVHPEPYLRRTFHGTSAELQTIVTAALNGTADPPPPDPRAAPGY
jgi:hypothetical protein